MITYDGEEIKINLVKKTTMKCLIIPSENIKDQVFSSKSYDRKKMIKKFVLTSVSAIFWFSALGQTGLQANPSGDKENNFRLANYFHTLSNKPEAITADRTVDLANIEGSMYYNEDFSPGKIYYSNKPFKSILARYNAYTDEIEIKRDDREAVESLFKDAKVSCEVNGHKFIYSQYHDKRGNLENGYLVKIFSGEKYNLFEKRSKAFKEGQQPKTSLHLPTPDKFVNRKGFYVSVDGETPKFLSDSKKKLSVVFDADKIGILKTFIKKNEIDLSKKEDLQSLLLYAETVIIEGKGV